MTTASSELKPDSKPDPWQALLRQLLALAVPITVGAAAQTSYHLINAFWVGRLGADAVAVVAICWPVNLLLISLGSGLSLAGSILVAQFFGAGDSKQVNHVTAQTLITMVLISGPLVAAGYLAAPGILSVLGVSEAIYSESLGYMRVAFASVLFLLLSSVYQAVLRSLGEAKAPLRIIFAGVVINAVLDPLFIFGIGSWQGLGVVGAAYATMLTQVITAVAGIRLMLQPRFNLSIQWRDLWPDWHLIGRLFKLGFPASIEQSMQALTVSVMTILVTKFGTIALAAYGIAFRLLTFSILPAFSLSMASSVLVGQAVGSGKGDAARIARIAAVSSFVMMGLVGLGCYLFAEQIVGFFVPNDPELISHGALVLRIYALAYPLSGLQLGLTGAFRGAGDTFSTMLLTLLGIWLIQLPLAYFLSTHTSLGELGLWWSSFIATVINSAITLLYFKSRRWLRRVA